METLNQANSDITGSAGADFVTPFAAKLMSMAEEDPNSEAAKLLEQASQANLLDRRATIDRLGRKLQGIGAYWGELTFTGTTNMRKKDEAMPGLRNEWSSLEEVVSLDPEARIAVLKRFTKGLNVSEEKKVTRSQYNYLSVSQNSWIGVTIAHQRPLYPFLNGFDRHIIFSDPAYITLEAILELSDYPNPTLDSFQTFLAQSHARGELVGSTGDVQLPVFLEAFNNWLPTIVEQSK